MVENPLAGYGGRKTFWMADHIEYFKALGKCPTMQDINFDRYLVFDMETTGISTKKDCATQLGWLQWHDGAIKSSGCVLLQLPEGVSIHKEASEVTGITNEMCAKDGVNRTEAVATLVGLMNELYLAGYEIVGHNAIAFDFEMLKHENERLPEAYRVDIGKLQSQCIDTGMFAKACQMYHATTAERSQHYILPDFAEARQQYFKRISAIRAKVKWNLGFCADFFSLDMVKLAGDGSLHNAETDCKVAHGLMQKYREMMGVAA